MVKNNKFHVYVLININKPVYIGCSSNIHSRLRYHKHKGKTFTTYEILESFNNKRDALIAERSIIKYLSLFGGKDLLNVPYFQLVLKKAYLENQ